MAALDTRNGKIVWEKRLAYAACEGGGGATATAGGLVFHVEPDGVFQAYDAKTGDRALAVPDRRSRDCRAAPVPAAARPIVLRERRPAIRRAHR